MNASRPHTDGERHDGDTTRILHVVTDHGLVPLDQLPPEVPRPRTSEALRAAGYVPPTLIKSRDPEDFAEDATDSIMHDLCKVTRHDPCPRCWDCEPKHFTSKSLIDPDRPSVYCDSCMADILERNRAEKRKEKLVTIGTWLVVGLVAAGNLAAWIVGVITITGWLWGAK